MTSKQTKSRPLVKNSILAKPRFQKGKFLQSAVQPNSSSEDPGSQVLIPAKKPFTLTDKQLLEACESGDLDIVYVKLWDKANVNCKRPVYGSTPLAVACRNGFPKIVNVLLEFGANMSSDEFGCTPLHWAANSGKSQIITSLIKKAHLSIDDIHKKDQFGSTPLHFASVRNSSESVQTLITAGSNPHITNNDGRKASELTSDQNIKGILLGKTYISDHSDKEQKLEQAAKTTKKGKKKNKFFLKLKPMPASKALVKPFKSLPKLNENLAKQTPPVIATKPKTPQKSPMQKSVLAAKSFTPK